MLLSEDYALNTQRGAVITLRTKTGRSHWQPFFISQDQAFLFANLLTPSAGALAVSTCMTFTAGEPQGVYFFLEERSKITSPTAPGVQLGVSMPPLF